MNDWFIKYVYTLGPHAGTSDYIGPFSSHDAAHYHRMLYGPKDGTITQADDKSAGHLSPEEHVEYISKRL